MSTYDIHIHGLEDWNEMVKDDLGIIVDPIIFRIGQFFLEGGSDGANKGRWNAITSDIGALVRFFDLVVLHDKLPAFNYADTFDQGLDFGDRLGEVLNEAGDKTLFHINVEYAMYRAAKQSAVGQLRNRLEEGPFVPEGTAAEILHTIKAIQYEWEPSLEELESELPDFESETAGAFSPRPARLCRIRATDRLSPCPCTKAKLVADIRRLAYFAATAGSGHLQRAGKTGAGWRTWVAQH